jgi:hypothetical protein
MTLRTTHKRFTALFDMFNMQIFTLDTEDEEVITLLGLLRIGIDLCTELEEAIAELQTMADDGLRKETEKKGGK